VAKVGLEVRNSAFVEAERMAKFMENRERHVHACVPPRTRRPQYWAPEHHNGVWRTTNAGSKHSEQRGTPAAS
jgi:hypothetical protein